MRIEQAGKAAYRGTTDSQGNFRFEEIKPGTYTIDFSKSGFSVSDASAAARKPFTLGVSASIRLEPRLTPFGRISGRVLDADGEPIADARLLLRGSRVGLTGTSDSRGQFSFSAAPGRYTLLVVARGLGDACGTLPLFVPSYKGFAYDGLSSLDRNEAASWINEKTVFGFDPARLAIDTVACEISTLDAEGLAPSFIKLDVQGWESNVIQGGIETLRKYRPVLLVESFGSDPRTARLTECLGYEEYHFDRGRLQRGSPARSPNSFLITRG